jgi:hypothetical protein
MKTVPKIGVAGAIWGILSPVLLVIPIMSKRDAWTGETARINLIQAGELSEALLIFLPICLMGVLGLVGLIFSQKRPRFGKTLVWIGGVFMFAVSLISIFSLGIFFIPASILLIIGAIGKSR